MAENSKIGWTDHTFNPWMGCLKVSAGCKNCYAETLTTNRMGLRLWGPKSDRQVTKTWGNPRAWHRRAVESGESLRVFCGSLLDVFEDHPTANAARPELWNLIRECTGLDWQLLTKRPENIAAMLPDDWGDGWEHVWTGTSIEDKRVLWRRDRLVEVPAAVRFISYEPALGSLDNLDLDGINWLIYGGESGPGFRPEGEPGDPKAWARSVRQRCDEAGVAFFHKQSAAPRTETGIELDGELVQAYPRPRRRLGVQRELFA